MEEIRCPLEEMRILKIQEPLGYGHANLVESRQVGSRPGNTNLIEAGHPAWMAGNPDIVGYNCKTPGLYESCCWKPRVSSKICAENIERINGNQPYSLPAANGHRVSIRPGMSADLLCPTRDTLRNPLERILPRCNGKWRNFANRFEIFCVRDNHSRMKDPGCPSNENEIAATDEHWDRD